MALNSRDERTSLISLGLPFGRVLPHRDGSITEEDFEQFLYLYRGLQAAEPTEPVDGLYQAVSGPPLAIIFAGVVPVEDVVYAEIIDVDEGLIFVGVSASDLDDYEPIPPAPAPVAYTGVS